MKKLMLKSMAVMALAATGLYGCASSDTMEDSTAMEETTMSETQTMAGDTDMMDDDTNVSAEEQTEVEMQPGEVDYSEMFNTVENTEQHDLVSLAKMDPNLTTFVMLVEQAGIADDLMQGESMTLFVPTNAAFAELPEDSLSMLIKPEHKAQLIKILQAHVLPTEMMSSGFSSNQRIETGGGEYVMIDVGPDNNYVSVGGATVLRADVKASNGIIHVVDKVVTPTETTVDQY